MVLTIVTKGVHHKRPFSVSQYENVSDYPCLWSANPQGYWYPGKQEDAQGARQRFLPQLCHTTLSKWAYSVNALFLGWNGAQQEWWLMPVILVFGRRRQNDLCKVEASLCYTVVFRPASGMVLQKNRTEERKARMEWRRKERGREMGEEKKGGGKKMRKSDFPLVLFIGCHQYQMEGIKWAFKL